MTLPRRRDRREERSNESEGKGSGSTQASPAAKRHLTGHRWTRPALERHRVSHGLPKECLCHGSKGLDKDWEGLHQFNDIQIKTDSAGMSNLRFADMTKANTWSDKDKCSVTMSHPNGGA